MTEIYTLDVETLTLKRVELICQDHNLSGPSFSFKVLLKQACDIIDFLINIFLGVNGCERPRRADALPFFPLRRPHDGGRQTEMRLEEEVDGEFARHEMDDRAYFGDVAACLLTYTSSDGKAGLKRSEKAYIDT